MSDVAAVVVTHGPAAELGGRTRTLGIATIEAPFVLLANPDTLPAADAVGLLQRGAGTGRAFRDSAIGEWESS